MSETIKTTRTEDTRQAGRQLAENLQGGEVLALTGDLGGGKTTLLQGLADGLQVKDTVNSPTFNIVKEYRTDSGKTFYHIDAYRLGSGQELLSLGLEEMLADPQGIVAIEWADRVQEVLPKDRIDIELKYTGRNKREIVLNDKL